MSKHSENRSNIFDAIDNDDVRAKAAVSSHQGQQSAERPNCIFLTGGVQSSPGGRCGAGKQIWLNDHFRYVESTLLMNSFRQCIDSVELTCTIKLSFRGCTISTWKLKVRPEMFWMFCVFELSQKRRLVTSGFTGAVWRCLKTEHQGLKSFHHVSIGQTDGGWLLLVIHIDILIFKTKVLGSRQNQYLKYLFRYVYKSSGSFTKGNASEAWSTQINSK